MTKRNKNQRGGKMLGRGGYGCAIAPAKMCTNKMDSKDKVSKLINMSRMDKEEIEELNEEFKISQKFKKVDPNNKYFLGGIEKCNIASLSIKKSDLKACKFPTKTPIPLLNIIMKKGQDFNKIAPKLKKEDLLKSIAHLLNGAKISIHSLNLLMLDIKHLNILYVNSETEINKIHPVFIDFGPSLIAQSKREFKHQLKTYDGFYAVWPLEVLLIMYTNLQKTSRPTTRSELKEFAKSIKDYIGFDVVKDKLAMEGIVDQLKRDLHSSSNKYKMVMEKIMVYEIARSYSHLFSEKSPLRNIIDPMMYPDYEERLSIDQALKMIEKKIGSVKEQDLLITYKKLNVFQKIHNFMTKPVQNGGTLSNLTKSVLLRRIRKYEKESGNKSRISMKNKKQVMIDYLDKHKKKLGKIRRNYTNLIQH